MLPLLVAASAAAQVPAASGVLRPGIVADASRELLFVSTSAGQVEAVAVGDGRSVWASPAATFPLAFDGRLLLAAAEEAEPGPRLPLVLLDPDREGRSVHAAVLALPADVRARVGDAPGRAFLVRASPNDGGFAGEWSYRESTSGGRRPPDAQPPERHLSGAFRLRVSKNGIEVAAGAGESAAGTEARWNPRDGLSAQAEGGRGGPLTLRRWDARGRPLEARALLERALVFLPSADERHLLAIERVGAGTPEDPEYRWSIFDLATGDRVGERRDDLSASPFVVCGDRLVFVAPPGSRLRDGRTVEEPLRIRAVDLRTGEGRWERPVRDLVERTAPPIR